MRQPIKISRISAKHTRERTLFGKAILVCAYDEISKFQSNNLEGAISWQTFQDRLPKIDKYQEIIFYCS
ncbi:MAG: ArsR family transcriptional regulator [Desulfobacteraceae bacterium]|nr:ArsR family transcriptional regulator [Desulfobacteraceae bacterium]